ncbi:gluconokinase [Microvirga sp. G4-2]|uniref:gluconokinase n=1 Tax=Microvirga sp. G4-2 TaxID=3434467 RepID=UPI004043A3CF
MKEQGEVAQEPSANLPAVVIVMGVAGSGKTTIGSMLAQQLHWEFQDADWFHPAANVEKMRAGVPLTDEDRRPWLSAIAAWIDETRGAGRHGVVACSALRRVYRDILMACRSDVQLVYLRGERDLIARRMAARKDHFMPTALLDSQFATLEEPGVDEHPIIVSIDATPQVTVDIIAGELATAVSGSSHRRMLPNPSDAAL